MPEDATGALPARLWKLAKYVDERVSEGRRSGEIVEVAAIYVKATATNLWYGDQGAVSVGVSREYVQRPEWHWRHQHTFAEEAIHASAAFEECVPLVASEGAADLGQAKFWLSQFVGRLMSRLADTQSDEDLVNLVATFIADLQHGPMNIDVSAWISGLWLGSPSVVASEVLLRRPEAKDFEYERSFDLYLGPSVDPWSAILPPAIASFQLRGAETAEAQKAVGTLVNALRLYRLGSVHSMKYVVTPKSVIRSGGTLGTSGSVAAPYKYELGSADGEPLSRFLDRVRPLVPSGLEPGDSPLSPALIALRRYSDAVVGRGDLQERITSGITCLEALFLKDKERADLSYRLSLRVASLLGLIGFRGLEVQKHVHEAYGIRSNYIHGGAGDPATMQRGDHLCRKVLDYARIAVLVFLQLGGSMEKDDIVSRLDDGLLEEKRLEKLRDRLGTLLLPGTVETAPAASSRHEGSRPS